MASGPWPRLTKVQTWFTFSLGQEGTRNSKGLPPSFVNQIILTAAGPDLSPQACHQQNHQKLPC